MKGYFEAKAIEGALCATKGGREQVAVMFEIVEEGEHKGSRRTWYGFFGDDVVTKDGRTLTDITLDSLRAAGWSNDDVSDLQGLGEANVTLVIDEEVGNDGQTRDKIRWVNRLRTGGLKVTNALGEAQKKAFAAQLKAKAIVSRQNAPTKPAAPKPARNGYGGPPPGYDGAPPPSDDDIPF
jgi:hypothetical protein